MVKLIVYVSVIVIAIYLYKLGIWVTLPVVDYSALLISLICLLTGFAVQSLAWHFAVIRYVRPACGWRDTVSSHGITIFGKYIPGKVWAVMGRAALLAGKDREALLSLGGISLLAQLVSLASGLVLGLLLALQLDYSLATMVLGLLVIVTGVVAIGWMLNREGLKHTLARQVRCDGNLFCLVSIYLFNWLLWSVAFYWFVAAFFDGGIPGAGWGFVLATALGIAAMLTPGGLGIREGVLVTVLTFLGVSVTQATSISIMARFWFLFGESATFLAALLLSPNRKA